MHTHEHIMLLLISNREFTLRLLVFLGILVEPSNGIVVQYALGKLDVALCVLVAREHLCVVGKCGERFVQRGVHLLGRAFEEAAAAADEERVAGEDGAVAAVFEEETDAVLCVAGRVQCCYLDGSNGEGFLVARGRGNVFAVFSADNREVEGFELDQGLEKMMKM